MSKSKITLTVEELNTPKVDEKVQQHTALTSAAENSQRAANAPSRLPIPESSGSIWNNALLSMTVFGLLGGLLGWGIGEAVRHFNPDELEHFQKLTLAHRQIIEAEKLGRTQANTARIALDSLKADGAGNPWFLVFEDSSLTPEQKKDRYDQLNRQHFFAQRVREICLYGVYAICIAVGLGMADAVTSRNFRGAIIYGCVGALMGVLGGVVVSFLVPVVRKMVSNDPKDLTGQMITWSLLFGVLGLFISAGPGLVMGSKRKFLLGLGGGAIGGIIGGALYFPTLQLTDMELASRAVAIVTIGAVTGLATGLIENAAKLGWLKVVAGLIAGKQFILYRNPTFIGASPQCEIYLFKDGKVGRRHAALYIKPGFYELEDLGTGSKTFVNGKPVAKARLKSGDRIQIGATEFSFQEKVRE